MTLLRIRPNPALFKINRGRERLNIDFANGEIQPLVAAIDRCLPNVVSIDAGLSPLHYLAVIRAVFHSNLDNFEIRLFRRPEDPPWEDYLFPLSKSFGSDALCLGHRILRKISVFRFRVRRTLPQFSHRLGFYVISDGRSWEKLDQTLTSIAAQNMNGCSLAVIGPRHLAENTELRAKFPLCRVIPDGDVYGSEKRFPISKKKNLAFENNDAERVVILHDRIRLPAGWVDRLLRDVPSFDFYTCRHVARDKFRYLDKFSIRYSGYLTNQKCHYYLTYKEENATQLVDGGIFVIHMRAFGSERFDPRLHWGELEDVDLVLRRKLECNIVTFDRHNHVESLFTGHFHLKSGSLLGGLYKIWIRRTGLGYRLSRLFAHARQTRVGLRQGFNRKDTGPRL